MKLGEMVGGFFSLFQRGILTLCFLFPPFTKELTFFKNFSLLVFAKEAEENSRSYPGGIDEEDLQVQEKLVEPLQKVVAKKVVEQIYKQQQQTKNIKSVHQKTKNSKNQMR